MSIVLDVLRKIEKTRHPQNQSDESGDEQLTSAAYVPQGSGKNKFFLISGLVVCILILLGVAGYLIYSLSGHFSLTKHSQKAEAAKIMSQQKTDSNAAENKSLQVPVPVNVLSEINSGASHNTPYVLSPHDSSVQKALKNFDKKIPPPPPPTDNSFNDTYSAMNTPPSDVVTVPADVALKKLLGLAMSGHEDELQTALTSYSQQDNFNEVVTKVITSLKMANRPEVVIRFARDVYFADNSSVFAKQLFASTLTEYNQPTQAIKLLETEMPDFTNNAGYYSVLATAYLKNANFSQAGSIYRKLAEQDPYDARYWLGLGICYQMQNDKDGALKAYQAALSNAPPDWSAAAYVAQQMRQLTQ
ncbi:MAG: hypothetical protein K0S08_581 [Gammaproteobacteria bacterium]|jgi:hypothetical protein|nr:hypothetical protein [Gammaproteobacteria bacterium]